MDSTRASALTEIMQIEDRVKRVLISRRYMKIQQNVRDLKNASGKSILNIENPNNMEKTTQIRKNSTTAKEYLKQYEILLDEYTTLFKKLQERKKILKARLFS